MMDNIRERFCFEALTTEGLFMLLGKIIGDLIKRMSNSENLEQV